MSSVPALLLLLAACGGDSVEDLEVVATVDEGIPTVVSLAWDPPAEGEVWVQFGADEGYGDVSFPSEVDRGQAVLTGNLPDADVHFRLVLTLDGEDHPLSDHVVRTGSLSGDVPDIEVTLAGPEPSWGRYVLLPLFDGAKNTSHLTLLDGQGQAVWWRAEVGFTPATYVSALDGSLMYRTDGWLDPEPNGQVIRMDWHGDVVSEVPSDPGHHDFFEHEDGTVATLEMVVGTVGEETYVGDRIIEHPLQGAPREVWNSFDTMTPKNPDDMGADLNPLGIDWTHANSIDYDPVSDRYLVSLYYLREVLAISRATGEIDFVFGAGESDFALSSRDAFAPQHAASWVDGGVMLFDNHDNKGVTNPEVFASRAVRYTLDPSAGTARAVKEWVPVPDQHTAILGDARLLPNGDWYVSTGTLGVAQVVSASGELLWGIKVPTGMMMGRGQVLDTAPGYVETLAE